MAEQKKRIRVFKEILKRRGDIKISHGILQEFHRIQKEQKGKVGEVVSATKLSASVKTMFASNLKSMKFVLEDRVDPSVLGGVAVFLDREFLIDNTILGRLRKLSYGKRLSF